MSQHTRTEGEKEAQRVKRYRRYAASVGRNFCQLWRKRRMCSEEAVRVIAGFGVCQHHSDLLDRIAGDAKKKRRLARAA